MFNPTFKFLALLTLAVATSASPFPQASCPTVTVTVTVAPGGPEPTMPAPPPTVPTPPVPTDTVTVTVIPGPSHSGHPPHPPSPSHSGHPPHPPSPTPTGSWGDSGKSCSTGTLQCCQDVAQSNSDAGKAALSGLLGVVVESVTALVGIDCSAISVVGVGSGGSCNAHAVCCENTSNGGLVGIGCVPITL